MVSWMDERLEMEVVAWRVMMIVVRLVCCR